MVNSIDEVLKTPINPNIGGSGNGNSSNSAQTQFVLFQIASVEHTVTPLGIAHMNVLPVIDLNCGVEGRDVLGGVAADVQKAINTLKDVPQERRSKFAVRVRRCTGALAEWARG